MAKEDIIKSIQRVDDENGNSKVIFPYTSADAVFYDVENGITVADKIDGGILNDTTAKYNDVYTNNSLNGVGSLKLSLPDIPEDHDITMELELIGAKLDETKTINVINTPVDKTGYISTGTAFINEMSPDGNYLFVAFQKASNNTYGYKLYRTNGGIVTDLYLNLRSIIIPIRARFAKSSEYLVVYGTDNAGTTGYMELYKMSSTGATYIATNTITTNVQQVFFDTISYNGSQFVVRNSDSMVGTPPFASLRINDSGFAQYGSVSSSRSYVIKGDMRISQNGLKVAILSEDKSFIIVGGRPETSNLYSFDSTSMGWGSSSNTGRTGTWKNFEFNEDGSRLYGTYVVNGVPTLRVCDTSTVIGGYRADTASVNREITTYDTSTNDAPVFETGMKSFRRVPKAPIYNSTATSFDAITVGPVTAPASTNAAIGSVRRMMSSAESSLVSVKRSNDGTTVTEQVYGISTANITWYGDNTSLSIPTAFSDILIHPTNGYGYGIVSNAIDVMVVPVYIGSSTPRLEVSSSPVQVPVGNTTNPYAISVDGTAIAYIDPNRVVHVARKVGDVYRWLSATALVPNRTNYPIAVMPTSNAQHVVVVYVNTIAVYSYNESSGQYLLRSPSTFPTFSNQALRAWIYPVYSGNDTNPITFKVIREENTTTRSITVTDIVCSATPSATNYSIASIPTSMYSIRGVACDEVGDRLAILGTTDSANATTAINIFRKDGNRYVGVTAIRNIEPVVYTSSSMMHSLAMYNIDSGSDMIVYLAGQSTDVKLYGIMMTWSGNTVTTSQKTFDDIIDVIGPVTAGLVHAPLNDAIYVATTDGRLLTFKYRKSTVLLNHVFSGVGTATNLMVSSNGVTAIVGNNNSFNATLATMGFISKDSTMTVSASRTVDGWRNVVIRSDNPSLENSSFFAIEDVRPQFVIGYINTLWNPASITVRSITVHGPSATRYSFRSRFNASIITTYDGLTSITTDTHIETDSIAQRIYIHGYILRASGWARRPGDTSGHYIYRIESESITVDSTVNVDFSDLTSWMLANSYSILGLTVEHNGYVELFAAKKPTENLIANIDILK
jgi:hypothetical protein